MKKLISAFFVIGALCMFSACSKDDEYTKERYMAELEDYFKKKGNYITNDDGRTVVVLDSLPFSIYNSESLAFGTAIIGYIEKIKKTMNPVPEGAEWRTTEICRPLITTLWDQYEPFYNLCPIAEGERTPVGCMTLAVAQILAYHEFPADFADYKLVKTIKNYDNIYYLGSEAAQEEAAQYIRKLSTTELMNPVYTKVGDEIHTFSLPSAPIRTLKTLGYKNVELHMGMDTTVIINSLKNGYPLIAQSMQSLTIAHGWIIDGYMKRELVLKDGTVGETQYLLHYNWGWNGKNNGYFEPGIVDTREADIPDNLNPLSRDYIWWLGSCVTTMTK